VKGTLGPLEKWPLGVSEGVKQDALAHFIVHKHL
jgi:hypothetical protein